MSETMETNMATSHKDPRSIAPLLATIADFARLQESCNAQDASVVAMSEKVRRLERQRDELAEALREYMHAIRYADSKASLMAAIKQADDNARALLAAKDNA